MSNKANKKVMAIFLAVILVTSLFLFGGCSLVSINADGIKFNVKELTMELGSEKDINSNIVEVTPEKAENRKYSLSGGLSANGNTIFEIISSTNRIVAKGVGTSNLIATSEYGNFTAQIPVTVTYASVKELLINSPENSTTALDTIILPYTDGLAISPLEFTSSVSPKDFCDPANTVQWRVVNDQITSDTSTKKVGESYVFSPEQQGEYKVMVNATNNGKTFSDWQNVNVCAPIQNATFSCRGNLLQEKDEYSQVVFTLDYTNPVNNPTQIVEWLVDDVVVFSGEDEFTYRPPVAGSYKISAKINGENATFSDGANSATLIAKGTILPTNVRVDFDNCYPKFIVRWDEIKSNVGYSVKIINNSTGRQIENLNTNNVETREYFTNSSFDATNFLTASIFETSFSVQVKTLADNDGVFTDSPYSDTALSQKLSLAAMPFLEDKYYDGNKNYFISDFDNEFLDWLSYSLIFRGGAGTSATHRLYLNFSFGNSQDLLTEAFTYVSAYTGNFRYSSTSRGKIVTYELIFDTDGTPSTKTSHTEKNTSAWNAMRPHVNYDNNKARAASTVLKIETLPKVNVETSEQLYYIAEKGYFPNARVGSDAERYYKYARKILCYIITDDMTDVQKAHAIYDWIMWRVTYDTDATKVSDTAQAVKYAAYYLEGVLTDTDFYAVCDGMSKAYSLMCNMEGIPCLRVTGVVPTGGSGSGGHAWNKVQINNNWYIVDCTWGDFTLANSFEKSESPKEFASHTYFLLSDKEVAADHIQDKSKSYPAAPLSYNWFDVDIDYQGQKVDFYIDKTPTTAAIFEETNILVRCMLDAASQAPISYSVGPDTTNLNNISQTNYIAFEIKLNNFVANEFIKNSSSITNPLIRAFKQYGKVLDDDYSVSYRSMMGATFLFIFIKC